MTNQLRPRRRVGASGQGGFTFIELTVVIAILAILAQVSVPAFMKNAKAAHEAGAGGGVDTIVAAERAIHSARGAFGTLGDLAQAGLIDGVLASGRDFGYAFVLNVSGDGQHFDVTACPAALNRSGDRCFTADDAGAASMVCPPGQHLDPATGSCTPQDTYIADATVSMIQSIDRLAGGGAVCAARILIAQLPDLTSHVLAFADTNHDGMASIEELLNGNLLGNTYSPLMTPLFDALRKDLAVGIANGEAPAIPIASSASSDVLAFLDSIPAGPCPAGTGAR